MFILLLGLPCSGKDTVGRYISQKYACPHVIASHYARSLVNLEEKSDGILLANEIDTALELRGKDFVAKNIVDNYAYSNCVVINGLRYKKEYDYICDRMADVCVIYIEANINIRFNRNILRDRFDALDEFDLFRLLDEKQINYGLIPYAKVNNHAKIVNESSVADLHRKIDDFFGQLIRSDGIKRS